jgi:gas vesicle protein
MRFTAFLTGVAIGTAVGILVAQQSGEDTRQQFADKFAYKVEQGKNFVTDKVADTVAKVADAAHEKIDNVADHLTPDSASVAFPGPEAQAS